MKYVYKVVGRFSDENFGKILNKISKKFVYMYVDNVLYIALKSWRDYAESEALVYKTFRPKQDYFIEWVNERNINILPITIKQWCLDNLVRLDTEKFEQENQERLTEVWLSMDKMEEELQNQLEEFSRKEGHSG